MSDSILTNIQEIFDSEYSFIKGRFVISRLSIEAAWNNSESDVNKPGVYVFCSKNEVIKVGKSQSNAKSRACQHLDPKTSSDINMQKLNRAKTELILYNVKDEKDIHWIVGLEYFFEKRLKPRIPSARSG